jgi:hypothetical protein
MTKKIEFIRRMKHRIFCIVLVLILAGCATEVKTASPNADQRAKALKPPKGMALVYFVRPTSLGKPFATPVIVDGKHLGSTCGWYFVYAFINPGKHIIKSKRDNTTEITVNFSAKNTYFIEMSMYPGIAKGMVKLAQIDAKTGRARLQECTLSADNAAR